MQLTHAVTSSESISCQQRRYSIFVFLSYFSNVKNISITAFTFEENSSTQWLLNVETHQ